MSPLLALSCAAFIVLAAWSLRPDNAAARAEIRGIKRALWWLNAFYCAGLHRLEVTGRAPLPTHGPAILIANHTCGIDNLILQAGCQRVLGFLIAREFFDLWFCRPFCRLLGCIPVNRDGRDLAATRAALRALAEGRVVPIFPEGRILPRSGREFGPPKPGAAFIAMHARVPVIPAYIRGTPETNDVFKALRTPSCARLVFGAPLDMSPFLGNQHPDKETIARASEVLMESIRSLRDQSLDDGGTRNGPLPD
jgi:1-acyl-sn-glycerol-3-phosphate acyltransferase